MRKDTKSKIANFIIVAAVFVFVPIISINFPDVSFVQMLIIFVVFGGVLAFAFGLHREK